MTPYLKVLLAGGFALAAVGLTTHLALAQSVPPHMPGTICFTQNFWCWAQPAGAPGAPCGCPSPFGFVPGQLG